MGVGPFRIRSLAVPLAILVSGCLGVGQNTGLLGEEPPAKKIWKASDPPLSQPVFKSILFEHLPFKASDGAYLDVWMYRPETPPDVKVPAIVHLSPYFGSALPRGGSSLDKRLNENLTARGYAVVATSVRGTGFSEGCFEIGGPRERQDAAELFEHIAKQPWSNGNVAAIGVSYDGTAPQGALVTGSPHLKTIVPIAAISEWYKYNFVKGVQINPQGYAFNTYYVQGVSLTPNLHGVPPPSPDTLAEDVATFATRLCDVATFADVQRVQLQTAPTGLTDPYWEARNFTRLLPNARTDASVFIVHGLLDYNVKTHNLLPWMDALQERGIATKALLGQWGHNYPATAGKNARLDWNVTLLRWFDHWLKGIDTGIMQEPAVQIQDPTGVWREEDDYPPTRAVWKPFYLDAGGVLQDAPGAGSAAFVDTGSAYNPSQPTGVAANPGVAYVTPPLPADFRYTGEAVAHLKLKHSVPRGHIALTIYDVDGSNWKAVNWGFHNYNIRNDPARYDPVTPGDAFMLRVPTLPTDVYIKAGHRLGVVLAAVNGDGPNMLPPPSGGTTTVMHGLETYVEFPTIGGVTPMDPQPPMRGT